MWKSSDVPGSLLAFLLLFLIGKWKPICNILRLKGRWEARELNCVFICETQGLGDESNLEGKRRLNYNKGISSDSFLINIVIKESSET